MDFTDMNDSSSASITRSFMTISEKRCACVIHVPWLQLVYGILLVLIMSSVNVPRSRVSKRLSLGCTPNSILSPFHFFFSAYHYSMYRSSLSTPYFLNKSISIISFSRKHFTLHILHVFHNIWPISPQSYFIAWFIKLDSCRFIHCH